VEGANSVGMGESVPLMDCLSLPMRNLFGLIEIIKPKNTFNIFMFKHAFFSCD